MKTLSREQKAKLRGALARAYCYKENSQKVLDPDLLKAMAEEIERVFLDELTKAIQNFYFETNEKGKTMDKKPEDLTQSEFKLYTVIVSATDAYRGPKIEEMARRSGFSRDWVNLLVRSLKQKGWLNANNYPIQKTVNNA